MLLQVMHGVISVDLVDPYLAPASLTEHALGITALSVLLNHLKVEIVGLDLEAEASRTK